MVSVIDGVGITRARSTLEFRGPYFRESAGLIKVDAAGNKQKCYKPFVYHSASLITLPVQSELNKFGLIFNI